ncbi:thymopoietin isoform X5 [Engystomops pustulosus]|uniref:thymopoietin isoform X5 n=1 Tax=Engystomops pustulosus TaxID=76066 RepID=UPI003AFADFDA
MAEFLEDPSILTKEKLKNELIANNIVLPSGEQRKDVYVQLYRQHLSSRNRNTPDFSSDEERESTPVRGRGRPPGRKATKKTDKPTVEGESEQEVTSLSNEALREELLKYGVKPGPILGSTRKVYEQRLLKLKEQQEVVSPPVADLSTADNKQNGNSDSAQYSDNDEPRTELTFEPREPLRSKPKAQVTSRSKKVEHNESISGDAVSELTKVLDSEKGGRLQAVAKESTKVARRTPRKRVVAAEPIDDSDNSEPEPITEAVMTSSKQTLANEGFSQFESRQVDYQVIENFKHTNALRSVSEFTDLSRRTPKKQLISEKVIDVQNVGHSDPSDLLNTALIEDSGNTNDRLETPNKTRQLKITKFITPVKKQIIEKAFVEEKREDRDVLKEMFPYEISTPTGISASCRRPIKGAAGRPFNLKDYKDYKLEDSYSSSKYISKYQPVVEEKPTKGKSGRSIPIWIKLLILVILAVLAFLVYHAMETNEGNPFAKWLQGNPNSIKEEN